MIKKHIEIIGNECKDKIFNKVREDLPALKVPDATHVATAISHHCNFLVSSDSDLTDLDKKKIKDLSCGHGNCELKIKKVNK